MKFPAQRVIKQVGSVGIAGVIVGLTGFVVMIVMAKSLAPALNAEFMVFWSVLFWVFGSLMGIQFETTRSVRVVRLEEEATRQAHELTPKKDGVPVVGYALAMTVVVGIVIFASSYLWAPRVFGHNPTVSALVIAVAAGLYGGYSAVLGVLGGNSDWSRVSILMIADTLVRFCALIVTVLLWNTGTVPLKIAAALGVVAWVFFILLGPGYRSTLVVRGDSNVRVMLSQTSQVVVANLASSALVVGFPTVLGLVNGHEIMNDSAGVLFAISMTRAPLLLPLNAFQGVLVSYFVKNQGGIPVLARLVVGTLGLGVLAATVAGLVGPPLLRLLRPEYQLGAFVVAGLTLGAAFLALVVLTGTLTLAVRLHTMCMCGWLVAIFVTVIVLLFPATLSWKVISALLIGPFFGACVHVIALLRVYRSAVLSE